MRTLLFTLDYPPNQGGIPNYYGNLVKYWPRPDRIHVLHNNDNLLVFNKLPILSWLPAPFQLYKKIKEKKIDYVIAGQIWPLGWAAYLVSKTIKIKYSVVLHGSEFSIATKQRRKRYITKKILKSAEEIICSNSFTAGQVRVFYGSGDKISIVNPGVEVESRIKNQESRIRDNKKKYNLENKYILLSVGRLVKRKGFDNVLRALPEVINKVPKLVYVVIGSGEDEERLKGLIEDNKLNKRVILLNNVNDDDKQTWYDLCECFIMPSRVIENEIEGFGIVYLEANLAGKPVIAGQSGGVSDAVKDGLNGILLDPESIDEIAESIVKLALDKDLRDKLGGLGRRYVSENFNWKKLANDFYSILIRLKRTDSI